jgi:hypothetical protein
LDALAKAVTHLPDVFWCGHVLRGERVRRMDASHCARGIFPDSGTNATIALICPSLSFGSIVVLPLVQDQGHKRVVATKNKVLLSSAGKFVTEACKKKVDVVVSECRKSCEARVIALTEAV